VNRLWQQLAIATNWPVLASLVVLVTMGLISIHADDLANSSTADAPKQMLFVFVGLTVMVAVQAINYQVLGRIAWAFYAISILLVLYTVIGAARGGRNPLPLVSNVNGAYNWINFSSIGFPFSLQPAELMKISFILVLARYLRFRTNYRNVSGLIAPFALALVPLALILKQPDLGTALVFIPCLFTMLYVAGCKIRHLLTIAAFGLVLALVAWFSGKEQNVPILRHFPEIIKKYQRDRVDAMNSTDPRTLRGAGFQQFQAKMALGTGGWSGKGFGRIPIGRRVPESHNDMIFSLIGEQFGFFGCAVVLAAYIVLFAAGVEISAATKEPFGKLVALGIVTMLAGQTFLNIAVAIGIFPVTGITLPFVSYGGSSLLSSFISAGFLLNIGQNRPMVMARAAFEYD
jgi:cell division protein FtsW (lipid II flippase)